MRGLTWLAGGCFVVTAFVACSVGQGQGQITGTTNIPVCSLTGAYDLHPTFYGATRQSDLLIIRVQNGGQPPEYADHLVFEIDDTEAVQRRLAASAERDADGRPVVTLRVGPAGSPDVLVHAIFEPTRSCGRTKVTRLGQDVGLWAYDGTITIRAIDRGPAPVGLTPEETRAYRRLTDVSAFAIRVHDPRPIGTPPVNLPLPAGVSPSDPVGDAELSGWFRFEFDRAAPAQPFGPSSP